MQHRTRVKFCGITRYEDARLAVELGVDALGFVFYEESPRYVSVDEAADIIRQLPPFVSTVGLFVNASFGEVASIVDAAGIDIVQFHGAETAAECERIGRPYVKALRMSDEIDLVVEADRYPTAAALLIDSYDPTVAGGTGAAFEWTRVPATLRQPIILAGGLDAANVARAIASVQPYAVDVSTGIEFDKGIKDPVKMRKFMQRVK